MAISLLGQVRFWKAVELAGLSLVRFASGNAGKGGNQSVMIQAQVQLEGWFLTIEVSPREQFHRLTAEMVTMDRLALYR